MESTTPALVPCSVPVLLLLLLRKSQRTLFFRRLTAAAAVLLVLRVGGGGVLADVASSSSSGDRSAGHSRPGWIAMDPLSMNSNLNDSVAASAETPRLRPVGSLLGSRQTDVMVSSQSSEEGEAESVPTSTTNKRIKLAEDRGSAVTPGTATRMSCAVRNCGPHNDHNSNHAPEPLRQTPMTCPQQIAALLLREAGYSKTMAAGDDDIDAKNNNKRTDYISFDDYFMATAVLSSYRSKDPVNATGACIVDTTHNRIIGTGYNGFPVGCSDDILPWNSQNRANAALAEHDDHPPPRPCWLHTRDPYVVTAEVNAILNKVTANCNSARLYTQQFPNADSAKIIIQSGIAEVVYMDDENDNDNSPQDDDNDNDTSLRASRILLTLAGVRMRRYQPSQETVTLDFSKALDAEENDDSFSETTSPQQLLSSDNGPQQQQLQQQQQDKQRNNDLLLKHRDLLLHEANYDPITADSSTKRSEVLSWDDYFLSMAFLAAQRSKDPNTQVGACIVDPNRRIVGLGYNGFPRGCSDDDLPWARGSHQPPLHQKYAYVCHAEVNAILNKGSADVRGATLYVALFPCNECAKVIVQAGIRHVVYMSDRYHDTDACRASRILLQMAGVALRKHIPRQRLIALQLLAKNNKTCSRQGPMSSPGNSSSANET